MTWACGLRRGILPSRYATHLCFLFKHKVVHLFCVTCSGTEVITSVYKVLRLNTRLNRCGCRPCVPCIYPPGQNEVQRCFKLTLELRVAPHAPHAQTLRSSQVRKSGIQVALLLSAPHCWTQGFRCMLIWWCPGLMAWVHEPCLAWVHGL